MGVPTRVRGIKTHPEGTTILVLGILSFVICPLIGPLAWSMGNKAMAEVRYSGYRISNAGIIRAGRILGAISTVLMLLVLAAYLLVFCAARSNSGTVRYEQVPAPAISAPVASASLAPAPSPSLPG